MKLNNRQCFWLILHQIQLRYNYILFIVLFTSLIDNVCVSKYHQNIYLNGEYKIGMRSKPKTLTEYAQRQRKAAKFDNIDSISSTPTQKLNNNDDCLPFNQNQVDFTSGQVLDKRKSSAMRFYSTPSRCNILTTMLTADGYITRVPNKPFLLPTETDLYNSPAIQSFSSALVTENIKISPNPIKNQMATELYVQESRVHLSEDMSKLLRPLQLRLPPTIINSNRHKVAINKHTSTEMLPSSKSSKVSILRGEAILSLPIYNPLVNPTTVTEKCAAALICTPESYCNSIGIISESPVVATSFRVPLTDCIIADSGLNGKCCRDPNYIDPWPVNAAGVCAKRNMNTKPQGVKDFDSNFAEIPWQTMILKDSTKSLLCGGSIIGDVFILTTASCIQGEKSGDLRVKTGEWQLGIDNEPLPNQLITVEQIQIHPKWDQNSGDFDLALIRLDKRLEFATNIQPICISDKDPGEMEQCITTGWGKQALKVHEEGAIMHVTNTVARMHSKCRANMESFCRATNHDSCEFDRGSALACWSNNSVVYLKGTYSIENACGVGEIVRFIKPDIKWINEAFAKRSKPLLLQNRT